MTGVTGLGAWALVGRMAPTIAQMKDHPLISDRANRTRPFHVMALLSRAAAREKTHGPSIGMVVGEPDFPAPPLVVAAAQRMLAEGRIHYTHALGADELREAIANDYWERDQLRIRPDQIAVTAGASAGLLLVMSAILNPGDEVLMADPSYPCNREFVASAGGVAVMIPVDATSQFQPTPDQVRQAWTAKTKALLVASPANPTGTMLSEADALALAAVVRELGGVLIVDEIYQRIVFDGNRRSLLSLGDDVISVNSFSKTYSMTGWRLGWVVAPPALMAPLERLSQNLFISPSSLAQHAAIAAFAPASRAVADGYRDLFRQQRDFLLPTLRSLGFRIPAQPQGAFYGYCDVSALTDDSYRFCLELCDAVGVLMTPGCDFGDVQSQRYLRVSYTKPVSVLEEGVHRLETFLKRTSS
jgi:aspartate/methionine/tyrosine aminotransferase